MFGLLHDKNEREETERRTERFTSLSLFLLSNPDEGETGGDKAESDLTIRRSTPEEDRYSTEQVCR